MATAMDIVDDPDPGAPIDAGLKVTVTPEGWPVADNAIAESYPPTTAVVIFDVPLEPRFAVTDVGEAEMLKPGGTVTVKVTLVVSVAPPPVPVTVMT